MINSERLNRIRTEIRPGGRDYFHILESVTLVAAFIAFATTVSVYNDPTVAEHNPVSDWIMTTHGFAAMGLAFLSVIALGYAVYRRVAEHTPVTTFLVASALPLIFIADAATNVQYMVANRPDLFTDGGEPIVIGVGVLVTLWIGRVTITDLDLAVPNGVWRRLDR